MKKTISINLANLVYQIDEDAYNLLENYLDKVKATFTIKEEQTEILSDIEHRFAELFTEKLGTRSEVVTVTMVEEAIATLGDMELIEEEAQGSPSAKSSSSRAQRKLFRSTEDKFLTGVLGGLGVYFDIDAIWLRLIFVLLAIASIGVPVGIIYIILWIVMPKAETASQKLQMQGEPVNFSNLQENLKKNLNSDSLSQTGSRLADFIGEFLRLGIKSFSLILGAFILFGILVFSFVWFFSTFFMNFIGPEYIGLIFNYNWQFLLLSITGFLLIALPSLYAMYLIYMAFKKNTIPWGKSLIIVAVLWILSLVTTLFLVFGVAKNFKNETTEQSIITLPYAQDLEEIEIDFLETIDGDEFHFSYNKGNWHTSGFEVDAENKILRINTVFLDILASKDSTYSLSATTTSRGATKLDAQRHLEKFSYNATLDNGSRLKLPVTLELINEDKFRFQELGYTLSVPLNSRIKFTEAANVFVGDVVLKKGYKKSQLKNNTWLMTTNGLDCLTCPVLTEEAFSEEEDFEEELEAAIEKNIEKFEKNMEELEQDIEDLEESYEKKINK